MAGDDRRLPGDCERQQAPQYTDVFETLQRDVELSNNSLPGLLFSR